jgi:hypothetical protein
MSLASPLLALLPLSIIINQPINQSINQSINQCNSGPTPHEITQHKHAHRWVITEHNALYNQLTSEMGMEWNGMDELGGC